MRRVGVHHLKLVYAPFSNQEGEWFWQDSEMRELLSESKLYMIGQRREVFFRNFRGVEAEGSNSIAFDLECGDEMINDVELPVSQFSESELLEFEAGPKCIKVFAVDKSQNPAARMLVHWFTPDRLFYYHWRELIVARNLEGFRKFTRFSLYYVGISKKHDSFSRLFETAHEKRSRILGNERQIRPEARLTDELTLFLFAVTDLQVHTAGADDDLPDDFLEGFKVPVEAMTADAEKAFVKILQTKYNTLKYDNYPEGKDGLKSFPYSNYSFFIEEEISLDSGKDVIHGARTMWTMNPEDAPDWISVEGDSVTLIKANKSAPK